MKHKKTAKQVIYNAMKYCSNILNII